MRRLLCGLPLALLAACSSIETAHMRLPASLGQPPERIVISGIGGGNRGQFVAGPWRGSFRRTQDRLKLFDTYVRNGGQSEFVLEGPEIGSTIEARCAVSEKILDFGDIEFKPSKMAYRCDFTAEGRAFPARFELQEVHHGLAGALGKNERRGEIALGGEIVQIASVHKMVGSSIEMANPIGYLFEQDGRPVGAVELNGKPVLILPPQTEPGLARTLAVAAVTLGVFWDPANSPLDD